MIRPDLAAATAAILRTDLASFVRFAFPIVNGGAEIVWSWHLEAICFQLERIADGENKRLIIEVQPRSLKSFICSVAFPAWVLGRQPDHKLVTASYSQTLANQHCNECRMLMRHPRYRRLFPAVLIAGKDSESEFRTSKNGGRIATSTGATLTGRGGQTLILDDIQKPDEAVSLRAREAVIDWYRNTLFNRLDSKRDGAIIVVMQRLHLDDLAGYLKERGGWTTLSLPAIAPSNADIPMKFGRVHPRRQGDLLQPHREPRKVLDQIKAEVGSYNFSAQYQQEPVPTDGSVISWDWFKTFDANPTSPYRIVQSWDVAMKPEDTNDWSVCTTWLIHRDHYYLWKLRRVRLGFPSLVRSVVGAAQDDRAEVLLIEDKASGTALIQELREREACAAYIVSQGHEGWMPVSEHYDDGGFSGGNMDRLGLRRLLADVEAGRVNVIVVYKVDRLTRSLADFAKIVDVLDARKASFVSITQSFNTTTSMGRLTLNVLLSFAQFEREVTGERIRDKIAASKRKGMWMGGPVPLGYDVIESSS